MGNTIGSFVDYCPESVLSKVSEVYMKRKRKRKLELDLEVEAELSEALKHPKRKRLLSTANYIYQALFLDGKESDVTVNILNKDWKLHKVYLGQSQYFNSMFCGSWEESNKNFVRISVEDPNITLDALTVVFGSFYLDEIKLEPRYVVGVLAASTMFQMDGLIEQCCEIMKESLSPVTAVQYYHASLSYGLKTVKEKVLDWFLVNLMDYISKNFKRLKEIDADLMASIISNPGLYVIQNEMSLYCLLKKWLYLQLNPNVDLSENNIESEKYFRSIKGTQAFLLTSKGLPYLNIFQNIRIQNVILTASDIPAVTDDGIIPESWILNAYRKQWLTMLNVFSGNKGVLCMDEDEFLKNCYRCGRIISSRDAASWRWSGFSFGIDLVWTLSDNNLTLRRHRTQLEISNSSTPHHIALKVEVMNFNEKRQVKKIAKTGMINISLARGQEMNILSLEKDFEYPMYVALGFLVTSDKEKQVAPT